MRLLILCELRLQLKNRAIRAMDVIEWSRDRLVPGPGEMEVWVKGLGLSVVVNEAAVARKFDELKGRQYGNSARSFQA